MQIYKQWKFDQFLKIFLNLYIMKSIYNIKITLTDKRIV